MWKLETIQRIGHWRTFRKSLDELSLPQAIDAVAEYWQSCPTMPFYLEPTLPDSWPDPWQLISENYYCDLAKALGMLYTLCLTKHGPGLNAQICVYYDPETKYTYHLAIFDSGKYVINLVDGAAVNIESIKKDLVLKHQFESSKLKL